jgi:cell division protein ZapA
MADITIAIGGREFEVACKDGEEHFLHSAAAMLDVEASALNDALGRMPETRMLLMAGLMLADKTASLEDQLKVGTGGGPSVDVSKRIIDLERQIEDVQAELAVARGKLNDSQVAFAEVSKSREDAAEAMLVMVEQVEDVAKKLEKTV